MVCFTFCPHRVSPRYLPSDILSFGKLVTDSWNLTHSYHFSSNNCEISAVCPVMTVCGTCPLSCHISCAVWDRCNATSSMQSSHNRFGHLLLVRILPVLFFSSLMADSAALENGVCGSIDLTRQSASFSFFRNYPCTWVLALSITILTGIPTSFSIVDKVWCASLSVLIG